MAIDANGKVFAFHRSEPPIVELDRDGNILKMWGEKLFAWPHGIRVDRFGFLWITDGQNRNGLGQQVFKYSPEGALLMTLGTKAVRGEGPDTFAGPCDVAVAANGDIFVADGHVNARIVKFSKDGTFIKAWGKKGSGPGEFNLPHTLVIDSRGRLLVGDRSNNRIQIFDQDGTFLDQWTQFGTPSGMFITPDDTLYVVDYNVKKGVFIGSARDGSVKYKLDDVSLKAWRWTATATSTLGRPCQEPRSPASPAATSSGSSRKESSSCHGHELARRPSSIRPGIRRQHDWPRFRIHRLPQRLERIEGARENHGQGRPGRGRRPAEQERHNRAEPAH